MEWGWSLLLGFLLGVLVAAFFGRRALSQTHNLLVIVHGSLLRIEGTINAIWRGEVTKARNAASVIKKEVDSGEQRVKDVPMDAKKVVTEIFNKL